MAIILQKILINTIYMKKFKKLFVSLKTRLFKKNRISIVEVPNTCESRAEKRKVIKATMNFLEQHIIIN